MKDIVIIGSLNMDTVIRLNRFPKPGETLHGLDHLKFPGGKGLNQATALSRLGDKVSLIGKVGNDKEGVDLVRVLNSEGISTECIGIEEDEFTGNAIILVDSNGDNEIIVLHGANKKVDTKYVDLFEPIISKSQYILLQYEIPIKTVEHVVRIAKRYQIPVVVNPSPYYETQSDWLSLVDYIVLNEIEAGLLINTKINTLNDAKVALRTIQQKGVKNVILTLGAQGAIFIDEAGREGHHPAFNIDTVDTTAAGDAFLGGLMHALNDNRPLGDAVSFANAVGALTVTKIGAQNSLPGISEVNAFLANYRQFLN
jgi:ribokinase